MDIAQTEEKRKCMRYDFKWHKIWTKH